MQTQILITDAFNELTNYLRKVYNGMPNNEVIARIINRSNEERIYIEQEDWGSTLKEWAEANKYTIQELFILMFPQAEPTNEALEFFGALEFRGTGDCPWCGGELEHEQEGEGKHEWANTKCNNHACEYANTTCPDFDVMPGGKDF